MAVLCAASPHLHNECALAVALPDGAAVLVLGESRLVVVAVLEIHEHRGISVKSDVTGSYLCGRFSACSGKTLKNVMSCTEL